MDISLFKIKLFKFSSIGYGAPDAGYGAPDAGYGAPDAGERYFFIFYLMLESLLKDTGLRTPVTVRQLETLVSTPAAVMTVRTVATPLPSLATPGAGGRSV